MIVPKVVVPVILSGGEGRRLWPLSRPARPKQFLAIAGERTLFEETARRLTDPGVFSSPIVICSAEQRFLVAEELRASGSRAAHIVLEPTPRNTAPAVAVAALLVLRTDPDGMMLVAPADHAIADAVTFRAQVAAAAETPGDHLMLFGVPPTSPATGYGYIEPGAALGPQACAVARFVEKPDETKARALIAGGALWNSGIFLLPARAVVDELQVHAPDVLAAARAALDLAKADEDFLRLDPAAFAAAPAISIDYALMERTARAAVVTAAFDWSDIGAWSAVWDALAKDAQGNATRGEVVLEDASGCLVFADGPRVAACGVSDLVIVATADRVLVVPRGQDQRVRDLADRTEGSV